MRALFSTCGSGRSLGGDILGGGESEIWGTAVSNKTTDSDLGASSRATSLANSTFFGQQLYFAECRRICSGRWYLFPLQ